MDSSAIPTAAIAFYRDNRDTIPRPVVESWAETRARLSTFRRTQCAQVPCTDKRCPHKIGEAWSPVEISERRANENVRAVTIGVFDLDHLAQEALESTLNLLEARGLAWFVHSTHSHGPTNISARLVMPLSRPVLPGEWQQVRAAAVRLLSLPADPATSDLARIYYQPTAPEGADVLSGGNDGAPLDVDALLGAARSPVAPAQREAAPVDLEELRNTLRAKGGPSEIISRALRGEALAPIGEQDDTLQSLMSQVAFRIPKASDAAVIHLLEPCFLKTDWQDGHEHLVAEALKKLQRARERQAVEEERRAQQLRENIALRETLTASAAPAPVAPAAPPVDPITYPLTDMGNGERFRDMHAGRIRYLTASKKWLRWAGTHWARGDESSALLLAGEVARQMYRDASRIEDAEKRAGYVKHSLRSESIRALQAMVQTAKAHVAVSPEELDRDHLSLNVLNGTVDLPKGVLRPHRAEDLITKVAPARFDASATAPAWDRFLQDVMPAADLRAYFQRAMGYAIAGDPREQVVLFLYGQGANGKTTALTALQGLLGDYVRQANSDLLLAKSQEGHPTEIAHLAGARLVLCSEVDVGRSFSEKKLKTLSGGDRIVAREMYGSEFELRATWVIVIAANHKPRVKTADLATWRRMRIIPFEVTIPAERRDSQLSTKLEAERSGILNWLIAGFREWQRRGLGTPPEVSAATDSYQDENDHLGDFIEERCELAADAWVASKELFGAYVMWCHGMNERHWERRSFTEGMQERAGIKYGRQRNGAKNPVRGFSGIRIRSAGTVTATTSQGAH